MKRWILLALAPAVLSLYLGLHNLRGSWDDGAITAAFAQTYADTGRIALTPASQQVEGTSSLVWFLLLSLPARISPDAILVTMKCLSALSLALALPVIYRIALGQLKSERAALVCVLAVAWSVTGQMEIKNGMEMNLALLLVVLVYYLLSRQQFALSWIFASVLLATRFESAGMLFLIVVGFYLEKRRGMVLFATGVLLSFGALELWRHHTFGVWMPNTAYAKAWQPYSPWHDGTPLVTTFIGSASNAIIQLLPLVGASLLLILIARRKPNHPASMWTILVGTLLVALVVGRDWGYSGRMIAVALPFFFICVVSICRNSKELLTILVVSQVAIWICVANIPTSATIDQARRQAIGADKIRNALGLTTLTVMLPDVGGTALYNTHLQIIDSAMLTNPELAREGYAHFADYFAKVQPEVFETHSIWAVYQKPYGGLLDNYSMVGANGVRFFVRNDLFRKLPGKVSPVDSRCLGGPLAADIAYSRTREVCLILN